MAIKIESCSLTELCTSLKGSEKLFIQLRGVLKDWLKLQPHLPQDVPEQLLDHFILSNKLRIEEAKRKLDTFYTMRRIIPEFYAGRDPEDPSLSRLHKSIQIAYLPKLTPEKYRVIIFRPIADDYSGLDLNASFKYWLMLEEMLMHDSETRSLGNIVIFDHLNVTLGLVTKCSPTIIKKFETIMLQAYAKSLKGFHHLNTGPITELVLSLVRSAMKPKLAARIVVHHGKQNYDSLHDRIPKSILPIEYGGDQISMLQITEFWRQKMFDKRDWFLEQDKLMTDESLRSQPNVDSDDLFGFAGHFRKLDFD